MMTPANKSKVSRTLTLPLFVLALLANANPILGQDDGDPSAPESQAEAVLIDAGKYVNGEFESARIDSLRNHIATNPGTTGMILVFCGNPCKSGEIEAHLRGIEISLEGKGIAEIKAVAGGYRETFTLEYWAIPPDACAPVPDSKISINKVRIKGKIKSNKFVPYDCCGYPDDRIADPQDR